MNRNNVLSNKSSILVIIMSCIALIMVMIYSGSVSNKGTYSAEDTDSDNAGYCYIYNNEYIIWSSEPILESGYSLIQGSASIETNCRNLECTEYYMYPYYGNSACVTPEPTPDVEGYCYLYSPGEHPERKWYYWSDTQIPDSWNPTGAYVLQEDITEKSKCPDHQCQDPQYILTTDGFCKTQEEIGGDTPTTAPGDDEDNDDENSDTYLAKFIDYDDTIIGTAQGCKAVDGSCEVTAPRDRTREGYNFLGYSTDCNSSNKVPGRGTITLSTDITTYYACYEPVNGGANSSSTNTDTNTNSSSNINNNPPSSSNYQSNSSQNNVNENADTGTFGIIFAWIIGIMAIGYSFYYFRQYS